MRLKQVRLSMPAGKSSTVRTTTASNGLLVGLIGSASVMWSVITTKRASPCTAASSCSPDAARTSVGAGGGLAAFELPAGAGKSSGLLPLPSLDVSADAEKRKLDMLVHVSRSTSTVLRRSASFMRVAQDGRWILGTSGYTLKLLTRIQHRATPHHQLWFALQCTSLGVIVHASDGRPNYFVQLFGFSPDQSRLDQSVRDANGFCSVYVQIRIDRENASVTHGKLVLCILEACELGS